MNGLSGLALRKRYRAYLNLQLEWITGVETNRDGQESKTTHDDMQAEPNLPIKDIVLHLQ